ncbi:MAG: sigma-70 family RNA polymerase sigma factor [Bacteroidota bacterium]
MQDNQKKEELLLWNELRSGNIIALGKVYDIYIDDLFSYGVQFTDDRNRVMDCIHDLFLDLYKYKSKLSETDNIKYYLMRSLKRKIVSKRRAAFSDVANETFKRGLQFNYVPSPEEVIIAQERTALKMNSLQKASQFLTQRQQHGLTLRFSEKRSYEEIAEIMNTSVETSRTIIYRAIKSLRKNIIMPLLLVAKLFGGLF